MENCVKEREKPDFPGAVVDALLLESAQFRRLYDRYMTLLTKLGGARSGLVVMDADQRIHLETRVAILACQVSGMLLGGRGRHGRSSTPPPQ